MWYGAFDCLNQKLVVHVVLFVGCRLLSVGCCMLLFALCCLLVLALVAAAAALTVVVLVLVLDVGGGGGGGGGGGFLLVFLVRFSTEVRSNTLTEAKNRARTIILLRESNCSSIHHRNRCGA